jgi:two-component system, sensor histidine kinase LadS
MVTKIDTHLRLITRLACCLVQCLWLGAAHAAPVLDLQSQDRMRFNVDVRAIWQTTMAPGKGLDTSKPLDAQTLWDMPEDRFAPGTAKPVTVRNDERFVGRLSVLVQDSPHSLVIELPMPRLDVAHLSYRYHSGSSTTAWAQLTAGDQIPMVQWPFASRSPAFFIPPKQGELQIILDIPQQGLFPSPVRLWADPAFREAHANRNTEAGAAMALLFFTMLICFGAAAIFKRFVFFAVGLYALSVALLAAGNGGMAGIYLGTTTAWFNDYIKYVTSIFFGALVPWTISAVVGQKYYSKFVAHIANFWLVGSIAAVVVMLFTVSRDIHWAITSPFLIASLIFGLGIALASVVRGQVHAYWSLAAMLLICVAIFLPIASYWGYLDGQSSYSITMLAFSMSSALLLFALLLQYRHGNRVINRAAYSLNRDALTGLLNRSGFERKLAQTAAAISAQNSHALFMYVSVRDAAKLEEQFGGEGFESGMVQMAAALSSSVSVVDTVARVGNNTFAITVNMAHDANMANAFAQKIITRTMSISSHSVPMAQTARIALAWIPVYGRTLRDLEKLAKQVLQDMGDGKRIGWIGGALAHTENPQIADANIQDAESAPYSDAVHSVINRVEREMLQERLDAVKQRAERLVKVVRPKD